MKQILKKLQSIAGIMIAVSFVFLSLSLYSSNAFTATCTATVTGSWTTVATWGGNCAGTGGFPGATDDAVINASVNVTVVNGTAVRNILIKNGGTLTIPAAAITVNGTTTVGEGTSGALTITSTSYTKTFVGLVTINTGATWNSGTSGVTFNGGITNYGTFTSGSGAQTFSINAQALNGIFSMTSLSVSSPTILTNNGTLTATTLSGAGSFVNGATGILNFNGSSIGVTTFNASAVGNTVNYSLANSQTVRAVIYHNLGLTNSGAKTMTSVTTINGNFTLSGISTATTAANLTIGGNLTVDNGILTIGAYNFTVMGTTTTGPGVNGEIAFSSATGTKIFNGLVTNGRRWTNTTANSPITIRGGIVNTATFSSGAGVYTFDTNSQALSGTLSFTSMTVNSPAVLTNNGTLTTYYLAGTGGFINGATQSVSMKMSPTITSFDASTSGNSVTFDGSSGDQTIPSATYNNLIVNKSVGAGVLGGNVTINGDLTANSLNLSTFTADRATLGGTITITSSLSIGGANTFPANYSVISLGASSTVTYSGVSQNVALLDYVNLTLSGSGTKTFQSGTTRVSGNFVVSAGTPDFTTNSSIMELNGSGSKMLGTANYYILRINKSSGSVSLTNSGTSQVANLLDVEAGFFELGAGSLTNNGTTSVTGTLNKSSTTGTPTFVGLITINNGGSWTETGNDAYTIRGGITNNGTFTSGTGVHTFNTNSQALTGTFAMPSVTVTSPTVLTNNGTLTVATALSGTGSLTNVGTLNLGGTYTITALTATSVDNTVNYTGAAQIVKAIAYHNLGIDGTLAKTLPATTTVNGTLTLTAGTLDAGTNNSNVTVGNFSSSNSNTRTIAMGNGTWTITGSGTVWDTSTVTELTVTPGSSTIILTDASASAKTFSGGGKTYNNFWISGIVPAEYTIAGSNGFNIFRIDPAPHTVKFTDGTTQTVTSLDINGTSGKVNVLKSTTDTSAWNISDSTGANVVEYVSLKDSHAATTGDATYDATSATNVNALGNTGWIFGEAGVAVTGVSSILADGSYKAGQVVPITVTFSDSVTVDTVGGTPLLHLETGTTDHDAIYSSGSPGTTLTFNYTVVADDTSSDLDYILTTSLDLNGGTINATSGGAAADLTLVAPGADGSLSFGKAIVIDTDVPGISGVAIAAGTYKIGSAVAVTITADAAGYIAGTIMINGENLGSFHDEGNSTYTGTYTVVSGNTDRASVDVIPVSVVLTDAAGNSSDAYTTAPTSGGAVVVDANKPVISSVAPATSTSPADTKVSYTLSEAVASGSITWTRTGGTADGGTHVQTLAGGELDTGIHTDITLTNPPTLVKGTVYSVSFNATDAAGNAATAVTSTSVTCNINTLPTTTGATFTVATSGGTEITVTTASDADAVDTLTYSTVVGPTHGVLSSWTGNVVIYTPNITLGADSFTFKVSDGTGDSDTSTIKVHIGTNVYMVNSLLDTNDSDCHDDDCTLREALAEATLDIGASYVGFDVAGTITPSTVFSISGDTTIDGGTAHNVIIAPTGTKTVSAFETYSTANNVVIKGLVIQNANYAITLGVGNNNTVENCYIGTNATGDAAAANNKGVYITASTGNLIVGNVISGNTAEAVYLTGAGTSGNQIKGNYIGTNATGTAAITNNYGVFISAGAASNIIGTNDGTSAADRNIISGNTIGGVYITGAGTNNNIVAGNYVGVGVDGVTAIPNGSLVTRYGLGFGAGAQSNVIGVDGDGVGGVGGDEQYERNVISGNGGYGISIGGAGANYNRIAGNYIGIGADGTTQVLNTSSAIMLSSSSYNYVGVDGIDANHDLVADHAGEINERNYILGNTGNNMAIRFAVGDHNKISGNYIGLLTNGTLPANKGGTGIWIVNGTNNVIGVDGDGVHDSSGNSEMVLERNVIAGFTGADIDMLKSAGTSSGNKIAGNYIGMNVDGTVLAGPTNYCIRISSGDNHIIGTDSTGNEYDANERNYIGGCQAGNIHIYPYGSSGDTVENNVVAGNYIGVKPDGIHAAGGVTGVTITGNSTSTAVGNVVKNNIISGNTGNGVVISSATSSQNVVAGNYIGTGSNGTTDLGNGAHGIYIATGAFSNIIGGDTPADANLVRYNGDAVNEYGIYVLSSAGTGNLISKNIVYGNQNNPQIYVAAYTGYIAAIATPMTAAAGTGVGKIKITATGLATGLTVQFFSGSAGGAEAYLGVGTDNGDNTYTYETDGLTNGTTVNATLRDASGNTSSLAASPNYYTVANVAPTAVADSFSVNEDTDLSDNVKTNDYDSNSNSITAIKVTDPSHGTLTAFNADGTFTYRPTAQFNGSDSFTYKVNDGSVDSADATVTITVNAVNDTPSFTKGADQTAGGVGAKSVTGWATSISSGPSDESAQVLTFNVSNDNNGFFDVQPAVAANGDLTYTVKSGANGSATVTVTLSDDGGGSNASAAQTFTITVDALAPVTPSAPDLSAEDDSGSSSSDNLTTTTTGLTFTGTAEADSSVQLYDGEATIGAPATATSGNWSITVDLAQGGHTITAKVTDAAGNISDASSSLTVTVDASAPTGGSVSIDSGADYGVSTSVTLTISATAATRMYIDGDVTDTAATKEWIDYAASKDVTLTTGDASKAVTVKFRDAAGNESSEATDSITLDTAAPTVGTTGEPTGESNIIVLNVTVSGTDVTHYKSKVGLSASIDCAVADGYGAETAISTLITDDISALSDGAMKLCVIGKDAAGNWQALEDVTVKTWTKLTNSAPVANDQEVSVTEDVATAITLSSSDADEDTLTYTITLEPAHGTLTGTAPNMTYTPAANYFGADAIKFKVNDGTVYSAEATVTIGVTVVNDAPTAAAKILPMLEDSEHTMIAADFGFNDFDEGDLLSSIQISRLPNNGSLKLSGVDVTLDQIISKADIDAGNLKYATAADGNGEWYASFKFKVSDGTDYSVIDYGIYPNVTAVNDAPSFTAGLNQTVNEKNGAVSVIGWAINISKGPENESAQTLTFIITSNSQPALFSVGPAISSDGTLTFTPASGAEGFAVVKIKLQDNGGTDNGGTNLSAEQTLNITIEEDLLKSVEVAAGNYKIGDDVSVTVAANNAGHPYISVYIGEDNRADLTDEGDGAYTGAFKVMSGDADCASVSDIPMTVVMRGLDGVIIAEYTSPLTSSGSVTIDAHAPVATLSSAPASPTNATTASFTVNGVGVAQYKYKLDGGVFGEAIDVGTTIELSGLAEGPHTVYVVGKDAAGNWQVNVSVNGTKTWTIDLAVPAVTGLTSSGTLVHAKTWNWGCDASSCTYRYVIDQTADTTPSGEYGATTTAEQTSGEGTYYIHVQTKNAAGTASAVAHVFAKLDNTEPAITGDVTISGTRTIGQTLTGTFVYDDTNAESGSTYKWYRDDVEIEGATSNTYALVLADAHKNIKFAVIPSDGLNSGSATSSIAYLVENTVPVLSAIGPKSGAENSAMSFTITATDGDSDTITYSMTGAPAEATLNSSTGEFAWTPTYSDAGVYNVTFKANDGNSGEDTEVVAITVGATDTTPVLSAIGAKSVNEASALSFSIAAADVDGDAMSYSAVDLPEGATLDASTGAFAWTPTYAQAGSYTVTFKAEDAALNNDTEVVTITVNNTDRAPELASIGAKSVAENSAITFAISATDADDDAITYSASGLPTGATFIGDTFSWTPTYSQSGSFDVTFKATANSAEDQEVVTITVTNVNRTPVLASIGSKAIAENANLNFVAGGNDPDGNTPTFTAETLPAGATFADNTFDWTPNYMQSGTYTVKFTASDGDLSASEDVEITVSNTNRAPVLGAVANINNANENDAIAFNVSATDADEQAITFIMENAPAGATLNSSSGAFAWTPTYSQSGLFTITFIASDGADINSKQATITVANVNRTPAITDVTDKTVAENSALTFTVVGSDPDDDAITYSLENAPAGASIDASTGVFSWTPTYDQAGEYTITFKVFDGSLTASDTAIITVTNTNRAPVLDAIGAKSLNEGATLSITLNANDADGDIITYSATGMPEGATLTGAEFTWTPTYTQAGIYNVTFKASDGTLEANETVVITVNDQNRAPVLVAIGSKSVAEQAPLTFAVTATDEDAGDSLTYSASDLPAGSAFNVDNRTFTWTPTYAQGRVDPYNVTFTVGDGKTTASEIVAITVTNTNRAPVLGSIGNRTVAENSLLTFTVSATDADGQALTYSASGLPVGATFNPALRIFAWTPTYSQSGTHTATISVTDGTDSASETITITVTDLNRAPNADAQSVTGVTEDTSLQITLTGSDDDGNAITFVTAGCLAPSKGTLSDLNAATGVVTYTPNANANGSETFGFKVNDGTASSPCANVSFVIAAVPDAPVVGNIGDFSVLEGSPLTFTFPATDADGGVLAYSVTGKPTGANFNTTNGFFSWTPTLAQDGEYTLEFTVTDPTDRSATKTVKITVVNNNQAPTMTTVGGNRTINENQQWNITMNADDPDGDNVTYVIMTMSTAPQGTNCDRLNMPEGATLNPSTGQFMWKPNYSQGGHIYCIAFGAQDDGLPTPKFATNPVIFRLAVNDVNAPPDLTFIEPQFVNENQTLSLQLNAVDPDGGPISYDMQSAAIGNMKRLPMNAVQFSPVTGLFMWTPDYTMSGVYNVTFIARDNSADHLETSEQLTITVINMNRLPVLAEIANKTGKVGTVMSFTISATDADVEPITYTATGLPAGASLNSSTGVFTWTPAFNQKGIAQVTFIAADNQNPAGSASQIVSLTITGNEVTGDPNAPLGAVACFKNLSDTNDCVTNRIVVGGSTIYLDATRSNGPVAEYTWTQLPDGGCSIVSVDPTEHETQPSITLPDAIEGKIMQCKFKLTVTDADGNVSISSNVIASVVANATETSSQTVPFKIYAQVDGNLVIEEPSPEMVAAISADISGKTAGDVFDTAHYFSIIDINGDLENLFNFTNVERIATMTVDAEINSIWDTTFRMGNTGAEGAQELIASFPKKGSGTIYKMNYAQLKALSGTMVNPDEADFADKLEGDSTMGSYFGSNITLRDFNNDGIDDIITSVKGQSLLLMGLSGGSYLGRTVTIDENATNFRIDMGSDVNLSSIRTTTTSDGYTNFFVSGMGSLKLDLQTDLIDSGSANVDFNILSDTVSADHGANWYRPVNGTFGTVTPPPPPPATNPYSGGTSGGTTTTTCQVYYNGQCWNYPAGYTPPTTPPVYNNPSANTKTAKSVSVKAVAEEADDTLVNNANTATADINNDTFADMVVGDPDDGKVYIFYGISDYTGAEDPADADVTINCISTTDECGRVVLISDISGDGKNDIVIGAPGADGEGDTLPDAGEIYIVYGSDDLPASIDLANYSGANIITGMTENGRLGYEMVIIDVDGNGTSELIGNLQNNTAIIFTFDNMDILGRTLLFSKVALGSTVADIDIPKVMLRLKFAASLDEALVVDHITLTASGTGIDNTQVKRVRLFQDVNMDGNLDDGDRQIGIDGVFTLDNGKLTFAGLTEEITAGATEHWIVVYEFQNAE